MAALRYIEILVLHLVVTLKFDPQFDCIKMLVWLLIKKVDFGWCYGLIFVHEIGIKNI